MGLVPVGGPKGRHYDVVVPMTMQHVPDLAVLLEAVPDAIISTTPDGRIASWNRAAGKLYGYAATEIVGRRGDVLFPPADRGDWADIVVRLARGELVNRPQIAQLRRDGSGLTVALAAAPIFDASGAVVGAAAVARDVDTQLRAQAKFEGLLNAAPDAMVGVARDGRITLVNAQAERLFGYHRDELLGEQVEILVPDGLREGHARYRYDYFADPQPRPMGHDRTLAARRKDGTDFPAEISLSALETEDGLVVSAAIRDVTDRLAAAAERERLKAAAERERLEAQLHHARRLESLGQLAGGVAHDFNNLLAVMINYTAFVAEQIARVADTDPTGSWETARSDLAQVLRAGERATALTHQLLAFGRREVIRPRVLSLNSAVTEVEHLLRRTLGEHIQLQAVLEPDLWLTVADPGQLEQVLVNLAVNARDAMPEGGTLTISTGNATVAAADHAQPPPGRPAGLPPVPGRYVRLRVADTGTGMPPEVADRAFEPFFTTKAKGRGTGLGLATVYGIITQAGGHVEIQSAPGAGTAVVVLLPVTEQQATAGDEPATPRPLVRGGETVLVVEDERALREVASRILGRHGYHVLTAGSGPEALKIVEHRTDGIHLLLTDVVMPQMLGEELAAKVRELCPDICVLYMSGYAQPVLASQGTLDDGVTLVEKPFSEPVLLERVREVLDRPR
jgi:hypothetical protein